MKHFLNDASNEHYVKPRSIKVEKKMKSQKVLIHNKAQM